MPEPILTVDSGMEGSQKLSLVCPHKEIGVGNLYCNDVTSRVVIKTCSVVLIF